MKTFIIGANGRSMREAVVDMRERSSTVNKGVMVKSGIESIRETLDRIKAIVAS